MTTSLRTKIGTVTVLDEELDVEVSEKGMFSLHSSSGEMTGRGETLEQAKQRARTRLNKKRVEVEVPFALPDGRRGVATGFNRRDRSINVIIDGRKDGLIGNNPIAFKPDIPDSKLKRFEEIEEEIKKLKDEARVISEAWSMSLRREVERALQEAAEAS